ncbi:hypothetical protein MRS44_015259 [Fusarium solani]|uniref:uncharacterized protein n=1 Tax=Fusarium solani TaxID=169388 RepID=UPI0032C42836|nr:hypothetical protein MRS44_015259 [Fusarium solani]
MNGTKREHEEAKEREAVKEGEVKAALEKAEKTRSEGGTVPFHTLEGHFPLYSITHFDLCYDPAYWPTRYIDFSYLDEEGQLDYSGLRARDGKSLLDGFLYLDGSIDCSLERFLPPLEASPEFFEIKEGGPKSRCTFAVQIIDSDHVIVKVSRELVFQDRPKEATGPDTFVFMGVRDDFSRNKLLELLKNGATCPRMEVVAKVPPRRRRKRRSRRSRRRRNGD